MQNHNNQYFKSKNIFFDNVFIERTNSVHAASRTRKKPKACDSILKSTYQKNWHLKKADSYALGCIELIAQEFLRLMNPAQPKTRMVTDSDSGFYIASEEVQESTSVSALYQNKARSRQFIINLNTGYYNGLGKLMVGAMHVGESDFRKSNMVIDKNNNIVKFDGDHCFSNLRKNMTGCRITLGDLNTLPFIKHYQAYNWLDLKCDGQFTPKAKMIHSSLSSAKHFIQEKNEGIITILMMPDELIRAFVLSYIPHNQLANILINELIQGRKDLLQELNYKEFNTFLDSYQGKQFIQNHMTYLKGFCTTGKNKLMDKLPNAEAKINEQLEEIKQFVTSTIDQQEKQDQEFIEAFDNRSILKDADSTSHHIKNSFLKPSNKRTLTNQVDLNERSNKMQRISDPTN